VIDFSRNHFALFGLPERYRLDADALDHAYRELQGQVHPDRFASGDDTQKRLASQSSARVNEAYSALKDPAARARYFLSLQGIEAVDSDGHQLPMDFLELQLERREAASDAASVHDVRALDTLLAEVRSDARERVDRLVQELDGARASADTAMRVRELTFLAKLAADLDAMQGDLDNADAS